MKRQSSIVFLYITLFMVLAGNSAIAETSNPTDFLSKAKNSYINKNYYKGDFYIARHLGKPNSDINNALKVIEFKNPKPTSFISGFYSEDLKLIKQRALDCSLEYIQHRNKENWVVAQFEKRK